MRSVRSNGHRAIGTVSNTPRGARGRSSDAVVAKCAGFHHFERSKSLDVETCAHADQIDEIGIRLTSPPAYARVAGWNQRER